MAAVGIRPCSGALIVLTFAFLNGIWAGGILSVFAMALGRFGLPDLPRGAIEHIKYPIVVDATPFQKATRFQYRFDETEALRAFADAR